ncbi:MAG: type III secretion system inner membrane ring lipoprotein SctJ [Chlamydiales bacterium]
MRKNQSAFILRFLNHFLMITLLVSLLTSCQSRRIIVNGLDEKDANEILVFLSNKGIDAQKVQAPAAGAGGNKAILWNISVEDSQASEAMALLNQVGLPRRPSQSLLSIFSNVGLVPTGMQEKIRYQEGLAEQIANTIRKIDGVLDAEVRLSFPEEDPLNPNAAKQKITASVFVRHNGVLDDPNAHLPTRIKRLVAGSITGLDYDNVTVIGDRAKYGDLTSTFQSSIGEEEKQYVNVWSIVLAKESLTRFRLIFFSFTILILLFILTLIWFLWKFFPLLKEVLNRKQLFTLHPIEPKDLTEIETPTQEEEEEDPSESKVEKEKEDESDKTEQQ